MGRFYSTTHISRKTALALAPPLSDHIKNCIAFLFQIKNITVCGTVKDADTGVSRLVLDVCIQDTSSAAKDALRSNSASDEQLDAIATTHLQIQRSFKEFKELKKVATRWSRKHIGPLPKYGVEECSYCRHFYANEGAKLWPGTLGKLTTSKRKLEKQLEICINDYVHHARLPRPSHLECHGFGQIPSVVTRFLLKDDSALQ